MKLIATFRFLFLLLALNACDSNTNQRINNDNVKSVLQGKTMGTSYNISIVHSKQFKLDKSTLQKEIDTLLEKLNKKISTYIDDSQIMLFNGLKNTEWQTIDKDSFSIIEAAQKISNASGGAYDITLSPLIDLWGFGAKKQNKSPTKIQLETAMSNVGYQSLKLNFEDSSIKKTNPRLRIDLSSIAKGYAVDSISDFLKEQRLGNHLVEIGGELKVSGFNQENKKWRVAIEQPDLIVNMKNHGIEISDLSVATSGDYRNFFIENGKRRSHIINPQTGYPIEHNLASVTVLHESAMLADGYATAILVLGETAGKKFAEENNIDVFMIIRNEAKYSFWSNASLFD